MSHHHEDLVEAEQDQHALEAELSEREAELSGHEARLLAQLQQFAQRNSALLAFSGYVRDEERALLKRAEALGPAAVARVEEALGAAPPASGLSLAPDDLIEGRLEVLTRRRELYAMRLELMDAREQLHEACVDHFEALERDVTGLEGALVRRQQALGAAARAIFMGSTADPSPISGVRARPISVVRPPDPVSARVARLLDPPSEDAPAVRAEAPPAAGWASFVEQEPARAPEGLRFDKEPATASQAASAVLRDVPAIRAQGPIELAPDLDIVAIHPAPSPAREPDAVSTRPEGPATPATLPSDPSERPRPRLAPIRVTLDVSLEPGSVSCLYLEEGHRDGDLPGVFIATPNLLKVDRDVRVRLARGGARLELNARVVWRETHEPSGMGVALSDVAASERATLMRWASEVSPRPRPTIHSQS
jgi:hypothetical protein